MSIRSALKIVASRLPKRWQSELKRLQFGREIKKGRFRTDEKEFVILSTWVSTGDWVLDIGANIGHYTCRLSELVGSEGRVLAFEPVPDTFELLASNVSRLMLRNVTLINMAASDETAVVGMNVPKFESGLDNYYMANITSGNCDLKVLTVSVDSLNIQEKVNFVKIDAEGHEISVLKGMRALIERDHPILVVEDNSPELRVLLAGLGYESRSMASSSNLIFQAK
ncbi:MAG: FkbM family methyltransferase [Gammaproteobacteria bacterium]|nr:FkbM family methyltransferase [Gammaproteobacteria bacterium]